jgi:flap endonuclease-1
LGVKISVITQPKRLELKDVSGKTLAIDAHNALYQFLSRIRGFDGTPLKDRKGRITSHLSGLLYRTANLVEAGIKPAYIFDGKPSILKIKEIKRRTNAKKMAKAKYKKALREGRIGEAKTYAQATSQLKRHMIESANCLLNLLGIPCVQAPSEGEAQAAYMAQKKDVWAVASQDYDSLLFGAPRLLRNLSITGKRKLPRKKVYIEVKPELLELNEVLRELQITRKQLVAIAILIGTDFNPDGVKGIGPKTALRLLKKHGSLEETIANIGKTDFPTNPKKIESIFLEPKVTDTYELRWRSPDNNGVLDFLCEEHDFSSDRVQNALKKVNAGFREAEKKTTLEKWFH